MAVVVLAAGPPVFSHQEHFEMDEELGCAGCHALGKGTPKLKKAQCLECHDEAPTGYSLPQAVTALRATFPHRLHADSLECADCHGAVEEMVRVERVNSLKMRWCLDCHSEPPPEGAPPEQLTRAPINCTTCHR